jgi:hypothetical protein
LARKLQRGTISGIGRAHDQDKPTSTASVRRGSLTPPISPTDRSPRRGLRQSSTPLVPISLNKDCMFQDLTTRVDSKPRHSPLFPSTYLELVNSCKECTVMSKLPGPHPRVEQEGTVSERFQRLAAEWKEQTRFLSNSAQMAMLKPYQRIIGMGPPVVWDRSESWRQFRS